MKRLIFIALIIFVSCSVSEEIIEIGPGFDYKTLQSEELVNIDEDYVEAYNAKFNQLDRIQIPISKIISGQGYNLYFALKVGSGDYIRAAKREYVVNIVDVKPNIKKLDGKIEFAQYIVHLQQYNLNYVVTITGNIDKIKELTRNDKILERFKID